MIPLQLFESGGVLDQLVTGAEQFAAQPATFPATAAVVYVVDRIVVLPIVRRALRARNVESALAKPAQKATLALVVFVAFAVAFAVAGFGNLLISLANIAAALTLALGFASQDTIGNLVSGMFLISDPKLKIGDWVEWNGNAGVVKDNPFRVSRVRTFNSELITVPNSEPTNTAVTNPVAEDKLRIPFTFGVGYEGDLEHAKDIIIEEAESHEAILDEPAPSVRVVPTADD